MTHLACSLFLLALAPAAPTGDVGAGPAPAPAPVSWQLELTFLDPRRIEIGGEVYWYVVYTVTNPSRHAQRFFPTFQIVTEDLRVIDTDMGISAAVFDAIAERHKVTHKYLVHPTKAIGALLSGDDHARESVAIWRAVDLTANNFRIYVAGLSGETRLVPNPAYDPDKPETATAPGPDGRPRETRVNPRNFTLRKTLEIRYTLPGSSGARTRAEPQRTEVNWVMR